jgi:hypothetical protein
MKVAYTSPIFTNADGSPRVFMIPKVAVKTYQKRDANLLKLKDLGGIHAPDTNEVRKLRNAMMAAKRKIEREMWYSVSV